MTRDEWTAYTEQAPVTPNQRGRIMGECGRLGLVDREERLAVLAELLGLDGLETTADLTHAEAGYLVNLLQHAGARAELPRAGCADEAAAGPTLRDLMTAAARYLRHYLG